MNFPDQARADAANDSYNNRLQNEVDNRALSLGGKDYTVFGYANDPVTGFHATAYKEVDSPHDVIIAYRGTDPDIKKHTGTTLQDAAVDATMVRDTVNPQKAAANAFTAEMIEKAAQQGISKDQVSVAGHSLGGTLAEIEAAKYGLKGQTLNGYGAVGLTDGPPAPGCQLTNYVMAGDVVSAANAHIGTVVPLASKDDIQSLRDSRYLGAAPGAPPPNPLLAMRLDDHSGDHFKKGPDNVLAPDMFKQYQQNYADNKAAVDHYRSDVQRERPELAAALRQGENGGPAQLPANIRQQLNEYLEVKVDPTLRPAIQHAVEQNQVVQGTEHTLQRGANAARAGGQYVQTQDEHVAAAAREAGAAMTPLNPLGPLVGLAVGEAAHVHGQAARAAGDFTADRLQSAQHTVEQGAHGVSQTAQDAVHNPAVQGQAVNALNAVIGTYHAAEAAGRTYDNAKHTVSHDIDATEQAVSHGIHATEHAVTQAYDATKQAVVHGAQGAERTVSDAAQSLSRATGSAAAEATKEAGQVWDKLSHPEALLMDRPSTPAARLNEPAHPDYALFQQARNGVNKIDTDRGRTPDQNSENLAGALTVAAKEQGLKRIDKVALSDDGTKAFAAQQVIPGALNHVVGVETAQAVKTPIEQSTQQLVQVNQTQQQNTQAQAHGQQQPQPPQQPGPQRYRHHPV